MCNKVTGLIPAILGISGTLLGVSLGWFLNYLSKTGKLKVFINSSTFHIYKQNEKGSLVSQNDITELTSSVTFNIQFDVYNSSSEQVIIRDLSFILQNNHEEIKKRFLILDKNSNSVLGQRNIEIPNINLPPKTILSFNPTVNFDQNEFGAIKKSTYQLRYKNSRNKITSIKIKNNWA
jgi:hypothetical protein